MENIAHMVDAAMVKEEVEDDGFLIGSEVGKSAMDNMLEAMNREKEVQEQKVQAAKVPKKAARRKQRNSASEEKDDDWDPALEFASKKEKAELKTFGLSSRPRRSVNYANIERGDEATSQSLPYEAPATGKRRTKRTRDEMDGNYDEGSQTAKSRKKTGKTSVMSKAAEAQAHRVYETELSKNVPNWTDERPRPETRKFGSQLDNTLPIKRSSGGFRRFISWMSDEAIIQLFSFIEEFFKIGTFVENLKEAENVKTARAIRHAWNSLPNKVRKQWEKAARMDCFDSFKLIGAGNLPRCEFPLLSEQERQARKLPAPEGVKPNCCNSAPYFTHITDVVTHYLSSHDSVHLHGCQFCNSLFPTRGEYRNHTCDGFNAYLMKLTMANEIVQSKAAFFVLSCADCGLWLPLRTKTIGQKCWPYYSAMTVSHSCAKLVPVLIFFPEEISESKALERMKLMVFPRVSSDLLTSCKGCGIESFASFNELSEHFKNMHPEVARKCNRCGEILASEFAYRHHLLSHYNNSMVLANYLKYSATYFPPPSSKRELHYGFEKENIQVGGFDANTAVALCVESSAIEDFVGPHEDVIKHKLRNAMNHKSEVSSRMSTPLSNSDSDSTSDRSIRMTTKMREPRPDYGYEHIDYLALFGESKEEEEAKKKLEELFINDGEKVFEDGEQLLDADVVLKKLEGVELKKSDCELVGLEDKFAEELGRRFSRSVELPVSSTIDPLKDFLLFNKEWTHCSKCDHIFSSEFEEHAKKCESDEDFARVLFHPEMDVTSGVRCVDLDCEERFCSIIALRSHAAFAHGVYIGFEAQPSGGRYDQSINDLSKCHELLRTDKRTKVARFTDAEIGMPACGLLDKNPARTPYPAAARFDSNPAARFEPNAAMKLIKPYVEPKTMSYECVWCTFNTKDVIQFQIHISKNHVFACEMCGKCFGSKGKMNLHACSKIFKSQMIASKDMCIQGTCLKCSQTFPILFLYAHILKYHFYDVRYSQNTGEIYPTALNLACVVKPPTNKPKTLIARPLTYQNTAPIARSDPNNFRLPIPILSQKAGTISPPEGSVLFSPPPKKSIDKRLTCYLCGMFYPTTAELDRHLELHPEAWRKCPFNCRVPISGHYDMQRHLLEAHMVRHSGGMTCQYCRAPNPESPCAHLVYNCRKLPNCGICSMKTATYANHVTHMASNHVRDLRRFQCTLCGHIFITMNEFYDHRCEIPATASSCPCSKTMLFDTLQDFCNHFDATHVQQPNYVCGLCKAPQGSYPAMAKHRLIHQQKVSPNALRKVYLLHEWLQPAAIARAVARFNNDQRTRMNLLTGPRNANIMVRRSGPVINISTNANPNMQQALDELLRNSSKATPVIPSVVTVDDDDDDDIVCTGSVAPRNGNRKLSRDFSPALSTTSEGVPELDPPRRDVNAQVRVETQDHAHGGQGLPGYVDDDDGSDNQGELANVEIALAKNQPKVKVIEDENADDELAVVAEVENSSGMLSSAIAATSREKKYKCTKCSSAFITRGSLVEHMKKAHIGDAGLNTSGETFGLPENCNGHICRSCCLVFESRHSYETHVIYHGESQLVCRKCSGIAFNSSIFQQHLRAHDSRSLYYGCGKCRQRFYSDSHLMEHLATKHGVPFFSFCKQCGMGSTDLDTLFEHVRSAHHTDFALADRIGMCPAALLNYEPLNVEAFKRALADKRLKCIEPSDCSHRSLLLTSEPTISCTTCNCLQSIHSYFAFNNLTENHIQFAPVEPRTESLRVFPMMPYLSRPNSELMSIFALKVPKNKVQNELNQVSVRTFLKNPRRNQASLPAQLHQMQQQHNLQQEQLHQLQQQQQRQQQMAQQAATGQMNQVRTSYGSRVIRPVQHQISQPVGGNTMEPLRISPTLGGPQMRVMVPRSNNSNAHIPRVTTNRPIAQLPNRQEQSSNSSFRISIEENQMVTPLNPTSSIQISNSNGSTTSLEKCTTCNAIVSTEFDRMKHRMHNHTEHSWFCSSCATSDKTEMGIMMHYYSAHLAPIIKQKGEGFRPLSFDLKCPHQDCRSAQFTTLTAFTRHLHTHRDLMPHVSECCEARFASKGRLDEHDSQHRKYEEENGVDGSCCPLCGTMDLWALPKDNDRSLVLSHITRHGLDYFSNCRFCFVRFQDDTDFSQLFDHYRVKHLSDRGADLKTCACGITGLTMNELFTHFKEKHALNMIRKSLGSKDGELVVRAGAQLLHYVGLRRKAVMTTTPAIVRKRSAEENGESSEPMKMPFLEANVIIDIE